MLIVLSTRERGEHIALRWKAEGTYADGFPGASAPVGTLVSFTGTDFLRVERASWPSTGSTATPSSCSELQVDAPEQPHPATHGSATARPTPEGLSLVEGSSVLTCWKVGHTPLGEEGDEV